MGMQKVILIGYLGKDPEVRYTSEGKPVTNFSLAVSDKKDGPTTWYRIAVWEKQGEAAARYLTKGRQVYVEGHPRVTTNLKDGKTYVNFDVTAHVLIFLGSGEDTHPAHGQPQIPSPQDDSDIPF